MHASDLFQHHAPAAHRAATRTAKPAHRFGLPCLAAKSLSQQVGGTLAGWWPYFSTEDGEALTVLRFDLPDGGKTYRPIRPNGDGWSIGDPPGPLPLYRLADLNGAARVYVLEGEKCADAAASLGLTATTSAHGGEAASKTDWPPLAGRDVVILRDNDKTGRRYADDVAAILTRLTPPATVRVVDLPDLPDGGDIVDHLAARDAQEPEDLRRQIEALAAAAPEWKPTAPAAESAEAPRWQRFPLDALPPTCRRFVRETTEALGVDASYVALPALTVLAGAIGNTRRIALNRTWTAPAVLWLMIVGESGMLKGAALKAAYKAAMKRQRKALDAHKNAMAAYESEVEDYKGALKAWKTGGRDKGEPAPVAPDRPTLERCIVSDVTVEALADRLQDNPRGLLLARDELSGWLGSFNAYKSGKGADEAHWLTMFDAVALVVDRKTGDRPTIIVPRAAVSITGGIQPGILRRMLTAEYQESGMAARLLMTMPPRQPKQWTDREVSCATEQAFGDVYANLWTLAPVVDDGEPRPLDLPLSAEALPLWIDFVNRHGQETFELTGALAAAWSKLEGYAARLALVVELAGWAESPHGDGRGPAKISAESVRAGIALVEWAKNETRRIYAMLAEDDDEREVRDVVEWIERRGGRTTVRELMRSCRRYPTSEAAEQVLADLVAAGLGQWEEVGTTPRGGQPTRRVVLADAADVDRTPEKP
ncbi:MAG TPA: DUF3987 domain-containing protein [Phycisphaerae bacterium]|nr:DUF3987 domain-containing protein [Phycisphaerae bacterium]